MNNLRIYIENFFDELEIFEDVEKGHNYKAFLRQAVIEFLNDETKETAFAVYLAFFDSYRIKLAGTSNPFIDLLDVLRSYEENASTLIDKQRDHYIHSVNVFILGLCFYVQNKKFKNIFDEVNLDRLDYPYFYSTRHEEFFFRWGIASLFHDVGYPVEIIGKQIGKFINFASAVDNEAKTTARLEFDNFEALNTISEVIPKKDFTKSYYEKYETCVYIDLLKPLDLLAHKLHLSLGVDLKEIKGALGNFVGTMAKSGFIDHGFYSALIVLKWNGFLIQSCNYKPEYFYYPVLDSASAILLHNFYKNVIMKPPFSKGHLSPFEHPIAYLLILCDELQEWNREAYGILDRRRTQAGDVSLWIKEESFDTIYITKNGSLPEPFSKDKEALLRNLLDMDAVFNGGFSINCESLDDLAPLTTSIKLNADILPRPLLDNLEKLAIAIHKLYNEKKLEKAPDEPLEWPNFSDLPESLKYSNLRQARSITDKLKLMGWEMRPKGSTGKIVNTMQDNIVETLAIFEHEAWVSERLSSGWKYGPIRNADEKISPYLIPYNQLSEEVKDLDRDTIRNIPILLDMIGMAIYRMESQSE